MVALGVERKIPCSRRFLEESSGCTGVCLYGMGSEGGAQAQADVCVQAAGVTVMEVRQTCPSSGVFPIRHPYRDILLNRNFEKARPLGEIQGQ